MKTATARLDFPGVKIHSNLSTARLVEMALSRKEGVLAANGALACDTGDRTGRSPNDKFVEDTPGIHDAIAWGSANRPITPENFAKIEALATEYLGQKDELFRFDGFAGADERYRLSVSVVTEEAWQCLFASTMFLGGADPSNFDPDWTIINACNLLIEDHESYGLDSGVCVIQSLEEKKVVICGTRYAGEIKKSIFYAMNFDMTEADVFPMHCSANVGPAGDVALFFGLSGTGKTTLSADATRGLIGDDEHGWSADGVFNFEGGCYAKTIRLSPEGEPEIFQATQMFGTILENVVLDDTTLEIDFDDGSITENTRASYPIHYIPNAVISGRAGHPSNVVFLTADAFGVLPPISRLTPEQAMYHFLSGYTAKVAGTERGVTEPRATFSACFGAPFLPRRPGVYAEMLGARLKEHGATVWLVNTGWSGGGYGVGSRMKLSYTRAMVNAALSSELDHGDFVADPVFGLAVPMAISGVPSEVLSPRKTWADSDEYDTAAAELAGMFRQNFEQFSDQVSDEVKAAGPH